MMKPYYYLGHGFIGDYDTFIFPVDAMDAIYPKEFKKDCPFEPNEDNTNFKTRFFYEDRETFMQVLIHEIKKSKRYAERMGFGFSIRLNGTSDISPLAFRYMNRNILDIFPDVMFYDYSKRPHAMEESMAHANYDITFSYDGANWSHCLEYLRKGGNVAVVFFGDELPKTYTGWKVIDGNNSDVRYMDEKGCVVGLHYHVTASDYYRDETSTRRTFHRPKTNFVVFPEDAGWNE
jgi:hypothetical protein